MNLPRRILAGALLAALLGGCCSLHVQDRLLAKPAYRVAVKFAPAVRWQRLVSEGMVDIGGGAERRKWQKKGVRQANKLREYVGGRLLRQLQHEWRWVTRNPELDVVMEIDEFVLWKRSFDLSKFVQGLWCGTAPAGSCTGCRWNPSTATTPSLGRSASPRRSPPWCSRTRPGWTSAGGAAGPPLPCAGLVPVPGAAFVLGFPVAGGQLRGTLLVRDCAGAELHRVPLESIYSDHPKLGAQRIAEEVAAVVQQNQARLDECRWGGGASVALHSSLPN